MPTQAPSNVQNLPKNDNVLDWSAIPTLTESAKLNYSVKNDYPEQNYLKLPPRERSSYSPLAMLFNAKERKPNILPGQPKKTENISSKVMPGPCGDGCFSRHPFPPPPTPCERRLDLSTFSSEDYSFTSNPNDMNSITSSDWGDEACVSIQF